MVVVVGDLQFIRRERGTIAGLNIVFIGEVANLCMSWFEAAIRFPIKVTQVAPAEYLLNEDTLTGMRKEAQGDIQISDSLAASINKRVDVIYTDCRPRNKDKDLIKKLFLPYQVTETVINKMNPNGFFLPCPPVTRGEEISASAAAHRLCRDYEAKEFLLHSQNAIMQYWEIARCREMTDKPFGVNPTFLPTVNSPDYR